MSMIKQHCKAAERVLLKGVQLWFGLCLIDRPFWSSIVHWSFLLIQISEYWKAYKAGAVVLEGFSKIQIFDLKQATDWNFALKKFSVTIISLFVTPTGMINGKHHEQNWCKEGQLVVQHPSSKEANKNHFELTFLSNKMILLESIQVTIHSFPPP